MHLRAHVECIRLITRVSNKADFTDPILFRKSMHIIDGSRHIYIYCYQCVEFAYIRKKA